MCVSARTDRNWKKVRLDRLPSGARFTRKRPSEALRRQACYLARWIESRDTDGPVPDETVLFTALRTCSSEAQRDLPPEGDERTAWCHRWRLIRDYLVELHTGLVYYTIGRLGLSSLDPGEKYSAGVVALLNAIDAFDPARGHRFSTYACIAIRRELLLQARRENRYRSRYHQPHEDSFEEAPETAGSWTRLRRDRLKSALQHNRGELSNRESFVLANRYPMDGGERITFRAIGDMLGLSKERVRQLEVSAQSKLREVLQADPLMNLSSQMAGEMEGASAPIDGLSALSDTPARVNVSTKAAGSRTNGKGQAQRG